MLLKKKEQSGVDASGKKMNHNNEIKHYLDGRCVCAVEAAWRLFGFDIHYRFSSVKRLLVHAPGEKNVTFRSGDNLTKVVEKAAGKNSKLEGWFIANQTIPEAKNYTYTQFPEAFTWKVDQGKLKMRERGNVVGRLCDVHASAGDTFFLRMILMQRKGATSFKDLRTVNGKVYSSFKEVCDALGLLKDDNQWHIAMSENVVSAMPRQLHELFVHIIPNNSVADPLRLWRKHCHSMSEDVLLNTRRLTNNDNLQLSESEIHNLTLTGMSFLYHLTVINFCDYKKVPVFI